MTTHDVTGGYRYLEGVFQYSGGVRALDGYRIERVRFRKSPTISEGFDAHRELPHRSRPAAHQLLRLRAALTRPVHGSGIPQLQRKLCKDAGALGSLRQRRSIPSPAAMSVRRSIRRQSRSSMPSVMPGRGRRRHPASSSPAAAKFRSAAATTAITSSPSATPALRECGRRRGVSWMKWNGGLARLGSAGRTRRIPRSTRCSTCIPILPMTLFDVARRAGALPGTSAGHRSSASNSKWTAGELKPNICFDSEWLADVAGQIGRQRTRYSTEARTRLLDPRRASVAPTGTLAAWCRACDGSDARDGSGRKSRRHGQCPIAGGRSGPASPERAGAAFA